MPLHCELVIRIFFQAIPQSKIIYLSIREMGFPIIHFLSLKPAAIIPSLPIVISVVNK